MFTLNPRVACFSPEVIESCRDVCPSTIGHMTDFGFLKTLRPQIEQCQFIGNAVTARIPHMDSSAVHKVFDIVQEGDVVCIDMSGDYDRACWGEMVSYMARAKKIAGAVIDGCVTDIKALREIGVPIYARKVSPLTTRILGIEGAINVPISIDGVTIHPGNLIIADGDGILVADEVTLQEYRQRALNAQHAEIDVKKRIDAGETLAAISGAAKFFE